MTVLRQNAMRELERLPEDKIMFVLQIMQGINGLYDDNDVKRDAFNKLEHLRKKVEIDSSREKDELNSYREEKYGK